MNKNLSEKQFYYKLATEEEKSTMTIQLLPIDFACRVIRLYIHLAENKNEYVLSKQILRSGTSIGANIMESQHKKEKIQKSTPHHHFIFSSLRVRFRDRFDSLPF